MRMRSPTSVCTNSSLRLAKGQGYPIGGALLDAGGECDGVGSLSDQETGAEHHLFTGTTAAIDEADHRYVIFSLKRTCMGADRLKIAGAGAAALCLHATNHSDLHHERFLSVSVLGP